MTRQETQSQSQTTVALESELINLHFFVQVPEAAHYFSELRNYPNASYRPGKGRDNFLPKYVDPSWDPRTDVDKGSAHVYGSQRYKYDRRPLVRVGAFSSATGPQLVMYS